MSSILNGAAAAPRREQDHVLPLGIACSVEDVMCVGIQVCAKNAEYTLMRDDTLQDSY